MQIDIIKGIYTDQNSDFRSSLPVNMIPVPKPTGISGSFIRPAYGIVQFAEGPDVDRGGINWNETLYRVMGSKLVKIDRSGNITIVGDVGNDNQYVTMVYSFDRIAVASNRNLFYWDGATFIQVTDPNLGVVLCVEWIDGYFMTTDGQNIVVTELNDPTIVDPLKYGSSEADPDPVFRLIKIRNEMYVVNRYTIELFNNVGAPGGVAAFPFARNVGAQIQKGAIGTHACCQFMTSMAFVGSARNETIGVYIGLNGMTNKISTLEVDQILLNYTEEDLSTILVESIIYNAHEFLFLHLPDQTLVYDGTASEELQYQTWFILKSGIQPSGRYLVRNIIRCYDKFIFGNDNNGVLGFYTSEVASHYGKLCEWKIETPIIYNGANGAIIHSLELVCLSGRAAFGDQPVIYTSYSIDGMTWSQEWSFSAGNFGNRTQRIRWMRQGMFKNMRIQRFRGTSDAMLSIAALEARMVPLYV